MVDYLITKIKGFFIGVKEGGKVRLSRPVKGDGGQAVKQVLVVVR
jgi:hypothetical protein